MSLNNSHNELTTENEQKAQVILHLFIVEISQRMVKTRIPKHKHLKPSEIGQAMKISNVICEISSHRRPIWFNPLQPEQLNH